MAEFCTLVRLTAPESTERAVLDAYKGARKHVKADPNLLSVSLWMDCDLPGLYCSLLHCGQSGSHTPDCVPEGLERFEEAVTQVGIPDLLQARIEKRMGAAPGKSKIGELMSISVRSAEPGLGSHILDELSDIFQSLTVIDGFAGCAYGRSVTLDEEIVGMAFWTDRRAFDRSLPKKTLYEVRLYQRIA